MKKRLENGEATRTSAACPVHSTRRDRVQSPERKLYQCTCAWDQATAAQLGVAA